MQPTGLLSPVGGVRAPDLNVLVCSPVKFEPVLHWNLSKLQIYLVLCQFRVIWEWGGWVQLCVRQETRTGPQLLNGGAVGLGDGHGRYQQTHPVE